MGCVKRMPKGRLPITSSAAYTGDGSTTPQGEGQGGQGGCRVRPSRHVISGFAVGRGGCLTCVCRNARLETFYDCLNQGWHSVTVSHPSPIRSASSASRCNSGAISTVRVA